jgi:hypothetical protein
MAAATGFDDQWLIPLTGDQKRRRIGMKLRSNRNGEMLWRGYSTRVPSGERLFIKKESLKFITPWKIGNQSPDTLLGNYHSLETRTSMIIPHMG